MTLTGYSNTELYDHTPVHAEVGRRILAFLTDCGEECDVVLEFDDPSGPFQYLFSGTTKALQFDSDGITVLDYDLVTGDETVLETFATTEINKATHWLLTTVNEANPTS